MLQTVTSGRRADRDWTVMLGSLVPAEFQTYPWIAADFVDRTIQANISSVVRKILFMLKQPQR
jgi:hypothetical protein